MGQFKQFVEQSGYNYNRWVDVAKYSLGDEYPMVYVNWNDATAYTKWVGKRLPSEAEWGYAARGGLKSTKYSWDNQEPSQSRANYDKKSGDPSPVSPYSANGYGLHDMASNVWE